MSAIATLKVLLLLAAVSSLLENGTAWELVENNLPSHMMMPVHLGDSETKARVRRQTGPVTMNQPMRILPVYSDTIAQDLQGKVSLIQDTILPKVLDFVQQSFSVAPLPGPILINNMCTTPTMFLDQATGDIKCQQRCASTTMCGGFPVPTEHLKQCMECNGARDISRCTVGTPAEDGPGVSGYEFVLYVSADQSLCPTSTGATRTVAFATSCQNEALQDRPIAGAINFCPDGVQDEDPDFAFAVTKHELLHALGFARFQFALWRDPATNEPRTPREPNGQPRIDPTTGTFVIDESTLETVTYQDWYTTAGVVSHEVTRLVTPAIREEGRRHFNCPTLMGVELENQGGAGTAMDHWEKRLLGNEAMTGQVTFNPVFSNFTFAAFEDSGWYNVNYGLADELVWGQGAGCRFAEGNCGEWIQTQMASDGPLAPFCETRQDSNPIMLSCTADHEAVSRCNRVDFTSSVPAEYQYFSGSTSAGGAITIADFCPIQDVFNIRFDSNTVLGTTCSVGENQPPNNNQLLESYGGESRCVRHGRQWTVNGQDVKYGGGCYQYSCSGNSVTITIASQDYVCSCSQPGREMLVDLTVRGTRHEGSIVCPDCSRICHAPSASIRIAASGGIDRTSGSPSLHCPSYWIALTAVLVSTALFKITY